MCNRESFYEKTMCPDKRQASQAGFTLVELAIVLVIIGLIIGGVLVGQDMIKAAEVRSTAGQIEKYNATVNTFRDKYQFIPGDITQATASRFGFQTRTGAVAHGDGNGMLEGCTTGALSTYGGCETTLFWRDLNFVNLIDGSFTTATDAVEAGANPTAVKLVLPDAKLGRGNNISVYGFRGSNYYQIGGVTAFTAGLPTLAATLTPQEAFNIDAKVDDGRPGTGVARAANPATGYNQTTDNGGTVPAACASATDYATTTEATATTQACHLRIRFN